MNISRTLKKPLSVLRNCAHTFKQDAKCNSEFALQFKKASAIDANDKRPLYWTAVDDPCKHNHKHLANFYTLPHEHHKRWLAHGLEPEFYRYSKAFKEFNLMVRKPALEVINYLNQVADQKDAFPTLKFVLHGRNGCGKSSSMAHLMHYAGMKDWLLVHVPWAASWNRWNRNELNDSERSTFSKEVRVDQPKNSITWLTRFKHQNEELIRRKDIRLKNTYTWNKREQSVPGDEMMSVVEFGMSRGKYATDVVGVVLKELKMGADGGDWRLMVAIDGVNAFWSTTNIQQDDDRTRFHPPGELSLVHFFKKLLRSDWHNGAVVCSVDGNAQQPSNSLKYLPLDLLSQDGFEHIDPFLPVYVADYDDKEFFASLQYFFDKKWFINPYSQTVEGIKEIKALSCMNPLEIYKLGVWM